MHASKTLVGAVVSALTLMGCGSAATTSGRWLDTSTTASAGRTQIATARGADRLMADELRAANGGDVATPAFASLPPAPWASERVSLQAAPAALVRAWRTADNRTWCAPVAPTSLGTARARTGAIEGGWMVEFDRNGAPGVLANGHTCARCGRAAFGIVGSSMTPEQLEDGAPPAFSDGSRTAIEAPAARGEAAAATITVAGQGCVYQVWSFLGEAHVRELLGSLRFVDVSGARAIASVDDGSLE